MDLSNLFDLEAQYLMVMEMKKEQMQKQNSLFSGPKIIGSNVKETPERKLRKSELNDATKILDELTRQQEELYNEIYKFFTDNSDNIHNFLEFQNLLSSEGSLIHFIASDPNNKVLSGLKISNNKKYILRFVVTDDETFPDFLDCSVDENRKKLENSGVLVINDESLFKNTLEDFCSGSNVINSLNDY